MPAVKLSSTIGGNFTQDTATRLAAQIASDSSLFRCTRIPSEPRTEHEPDR
jgi:hypothetical protein